MKNESVSRKTKGKREYLSDTDTKRMMKELDEFFESKVDIPLIRYGKRQRLETLIYEEVLLLAKYLRSEKIDLVPKNILPHKRI